MNKIKMALLPDRGAVSVAGADAAKLLQGLVTNDMALLGLQPAIFAALLTPQGKILFDFFIVKVEAGYVLETARENATALVKRLLTYKLRANVEIADVSSGYAVSVSWGVPGVTSETALRSIAFPDPRLAGLGRRVLVPIPAGKPSGDVLAAGADLYHAHRIGLGVPEGGKDYAFGDTFPHEALLDQLGGVSFTKGCFVGQEVVSRMEHRGTARKRVVPVVAEGPLPSPGAEIKAGEVTIGTIGSVAGSRGLALLRLDRVAEAVADGVPLRAEGVPVRIELPSFATFTLDGNPATA